MKYESPITYHSKYMANVKKFFKSGSNFRFKATRSKIWYQEKGLVKRNTHMKYESPITCHSEDMANVNVFADRQTGQKLYVPYLSIRWHKKKKASVRSLEVFFIICVVFACACIDIKCINCCVDDIPCTSCN
jgi:hypothetical protein